MKSPPSIDTVPEDDAESGGKFRGLAGTQTLARGLDILNTVADGVTGLADVAEALKLSRSTVHRLAATLVEHRYLNFAPRLGYSLGPKLLELGFLASRQMSLPRIAREHLENLAASTGDTVHLAVLDGLKALYLDKIPGRRRVEISSRVGERQPLRSTGIGKALILDNPDSRWREIYEYEDRDGYRYNVDFSLWLKRMRDYATKGYAFDLEENEDHIRCVAAPIRDASGAIAGAISVSSAAQYMDEERMHRLTAEVKDTAVAVSRDLGWQESGRIDPPAPEPVPKKTRKRA
jgi:DNA-binding IclR family transcriptional regulator